MMTPSLRRFALTVHVVCSVGWLGSVSGFLALSIAGLSSDAPQTVRSAYLAMELMTWATIVPLSLASLVSGLLQSMGTPWGLFRHYWVVAKLMVTTLATILLLVHMGPIHRVASVAQLTTLSTGDLHQLRVQLVADAIGAMLALLAATALSIYKPFGMTAHGLRTQVEENAVGSVRRSTPSTFWTRYALWGLVGAFVLLVVLHLLGGGMHGH